MLLGPLSLILVVTLSILITRVAAIALVHTGISRELAKFQARSAFTGAGFTTHEAERVVNHPVRRRIIMWLMFLGNAGIVTGITSLIVTFMDEDSRAVWVELTAMIGGLAVLWLISLSDWVDRRLSAWVSRLLARYTELNVKDYASLMHLTGEYRLVDLRVQDGDWLAGQTLEQSRLRDEGVIVLAVHRRDDTFLGTPVGETEIRPGDRLVLYGRVDAIEALDQRRRGPAGERDHEAAVAEKQAVAAAEHRADRG